MGHLELDFSSQVESMVHFGCRTCISSGFCLMWPSRHGMGIELRPLPFLPISLASTLSRLCFHIILLSMWYAGSGEGRPCLAAARRLTLIIDKRCPIPPISRSDLLCSTFRSLYVRLWQAGRFPKGPVAVWVCTFARAFDAIISLPY